MAILTPATQQISVNHFAPTVFGTAACRGQTTGRRNRIAKPAWTGSTTGIKIVSVGPPDRNSAEHSRNGARCRYHTRASGREEFSGEAGPGDFHYVVPFVPEQEINALRINPVKPSWSEVTRSRL